MKTIKEIIKANNDYDIEVKRVDKLKGELKNINDNINLEEIKQNLNYIESKELYNLLKYRHNDSEKYKEFKSILETKKLEEYPKIKGVHYYPIIKDIDFLSEKEKIDLDILIKDAYRNLNKREEINKLNSKITDFLINKSILEKVYIFSCTCGSFECGEERIAQERFDKLKAYWEKEKKDLNTHEEDTEMHYGCFEIGCWNDGSIEICSLEDWNENLRGIQYKIKIEPDMTLDKI